MIATAGTVTVTVSTVTSGQTSGGSTFTITPPPTPGALLHGNATLRGNGAIR
jgi:uncharacterized spore protein YtfJ